LISCLLNDYLGKERRRGKELTENKRENKEAIMPETTIPPPPLAARPSKPVSEALLNEKVFFPYLALYYSSVRGMEADREHSGTDVSPPF
jgi:hypothetical protein